MADLLKNKIKIFEDIFHFNLQLKFSMFKLNKARYSLGLEIYSSLKVKQIDCLRGVYMHHDITACLPTGYGKSLLFDILPYFLCCDNSIVIVIMLLNVIIDGALRCNGDVAYKLHDKSLLDDHFVPGSFRYLRSHHETLLRQDVCNIMKTWHRRVQWIAIDEAHCITQ